MLDRVVQQLLHVVERQLVDVADLVGVHEARIAHHVAAVGQVDGEDGAAAVLDRGGAVIVQRSRRRPKSRPGKSHSMRFRNAGLIASVSVKVPCIGHVFSMMTLPSRSRMIGPDLADVLVDQRFDRLLAGEDAGPRVSGRRRDRGSRWSAASRAQGLTVPSSSTTAPRPTSVGTPAL